jgi:hypothetical protein
VAGHRSKGRIIILFEGRAAVRAGSEKLRARLFSDVTDTWLASPTILTMMMLSAGLYCIALPIRLENIGKPLRFVHQI